MRLGGYTFTNPCEPGAVRCLIDNGFVHLVGVLPETKNEDLAKAYNAFNNRPEQVRRRLARRALALVGQQDTDIYHRLRPADVQVSALAVDVLVMPRGMESAQPTVDRIVEIHRRLIELEEVAEAVGKKHDLNVARFGCSPKNRLGVAFPMHQDSHGTTALAYAAQTVPTRWSIWRPFDGSLDELDAARPDICVRTNPSDLMILMQNCGGNFGNTEFRGGERTAIREGSVVHYGEFDPTEGLRYGLGLFTQVVSED